MNQYTFVSSARELIHFGLRLPCDTKRKSGPGGAAASLTQALVPRVQRPLNDRASRVLDEGSVEARAQGGEGRQGTGRARYGRVHW